MVVTEYYKTRDDDDLCSWHTEADEPIEEDA